MQAYKKEFIEFVSRVFLDLLKSPKTQCFQGFVSILKEVQKYRILSEIDVFLHQNGVENGVVKLKMEISNIEI